MMNNEFSILGIIGSSNMYHTCIMFVLVLKKGGFSMDWIVWEMLEKLKADKKILIRVRKEVRDIYETSEGDSKQYWKGLLKGYDRQVMWTTDNIEKLENMIEEEQKNDEAYDDDVRQLRGMAHE